ncbi:MAG: hypothetical protein AAF959_10115 [Cyanobacteria bacterium P01_D01_bin.56]
MKDLKQLQKPVSEPWMVHIYGQNRKLLWVLEPSHGWLFLLGLGTGLLLAVVHFNLARSSLTSQREHVAPSTIHAPALQVD